MKCLFGDCPDKARSNGMCAKHVSKFRRDIDSIFGESSFTTSKGKIVYDQDVLVVDVADYLVKETPFFKKAPDGPVFFNTESMSFERLNSSANRAGEAGKIISILLPPRYRSAFKQSFHGYLQRQICTMIDFKQIEQPDDFIHYFNNGYFSWYDKKFHEYGDEPLKLSFFRHYVDFDPDFMDATLDKVKIPHNRKIEMAMTILPSDLKLNKIFVTIGVPNSGKTFVNKLISRALGEQSSLKLPILRSMNSFQLSSIEGKSYIYSDDDGAEERHKANTDLEAVQFLKEVATRAPILAERKGSGTVYNISPRSYGVFAVMGNHQPRFGLDYDGALIGKRFVMTYMDEPITANSITDNFERRFAQSDILKYMFRLGVEYLNDNLQLDDKEMSKGERAYYSQFRYFKMCFDRGQRLSFESYISLVESDGSKVGSGEDRDYVRKCQAIMERKGLLDTGEDSDVVKARRALGLYGDR